jgi:hypothetical protein
MDAHTSGGHATGAPAVTVSARTRYATWLAALFVIAFLTPYVLADTLEIQRDVYYALYGGIAVTFAWAWGRATEQSWGQMIARRCASRSCSRHSEAPSSSPPRSRTR